MKKYPSQAELKAVFWYDRKSGNLFRRLTRGAAARYAGCVSKKGYRIICLNYTQYYAHRLVWILHKGDIPDGLQIDHRNRVKHDNRIGNLRLGTGSQNQHNRTKSANNKSGFKGVFLNGQRKLWQAGLKLKGKYIYIGMFKSKEEARDAHQAAARKLHKNFHCL